MDKSDEGSVHREDIKAIVAEVLAEQLRVARIDSGTDDVILKTIATILTSFGIEDDDRIELRADFIHLRKWRKSVEQASTLTIKAAITVIVAGVLGAFWLGLKVTLGR